MMHVMPGHEFTLDVHPRIPEQLTRLRELADDLWYSWHRPTRALFSALDRELWNRIGHNPKLFLRRVNQRILDEAARDGAYLGHYHEVISAYDAYHAPAPRRGAGAELAETDLIAYFCAEYGIHESLHIYSGGLGILAGHHCKAASDLRLPFVGVGLLYRAGYFSQRIDDEGCQAAHYEEVDFDELPVRRTVDGAGHAVQVAVEFPGRRVHVRVWQAQAGRMVVYLLDTDTEENAAQDRRITYQLYGGDNETRIQQELILGIGGVRALRRLGFNPTVWHLNEGHPAFGIVERIRELVATGLPVATAMEAVAASTVFTTHTPVPSGHDHFPDSMVRHYLAPLVDGLEIQMDDLIPLGHAGSNTSDFNMTTFAIRGSRYQNGVSRLHGEVSAELCRDCWPQIPPDENSMGYITNGVHVATVLAQEWVDLFDRFLGKEWRNCLPDRDYWQRLHDIPDQQFWSIHQTLKAKTLTSIRGLLTAQYTRNQTSAPHIRRILRYLDKDNPEILTLAFARRFATYKRATLLFHDLNRLDALLNDGERPMLVLFAGKAHPADVPGQQAIKRVHDVANMPEFLGKILLVEGYDLALARELVSGVDVWLNNPVYTMEASGTSGMKAAINGSLHLSVTDGWWAEGFEGDNGWAILPSPHNEDAARRDAEDARTLYEILQDQVAPLFYDRSQLGYSKGWVKMAKKSMASVIPRFNMDRVLDEYTRKYYCPAAAGGRRLAERGNNGARVLAAWRKHVQTEWKGASLRLIEAPGRTIPFGETVTLAVAARFGRIDPQEIVVELVLERGKDQVTRALPAWADNGRAVGEAGAGDAGHVERFRFESAGPIAESDEHRFELEVRPGRSGRLSYRIRMYPYHALLSHRFEPGLMVWLD
ncbi:MAG: alpha-glucan family phosphorylase [Gammaproteobacteria bacterium]|nr:alpha-glucan family phosphorylase [Gammaproteobacteria bacterium]